MSCISVYKREYFTSLIPIISQGIDHLKINKIPLVAAIALITACSDGSDHKITEAPVAPMADFSAADTRLEDFLAENENFDGVSIVIVDKSLGPIHRAAFGDHTVDTVVLLASTSKVPAVSLLMALAEDDDNVDFEIDAPISDYLPWIGVWSTDITAEHLVSNRSGIPGLSNILLGTYGPHICQYVPLGTLYQCAQTLYQTPLPGTISNPPGEAFDYGGSQWQLSGAVAEIVGGAGWNQLLDQYISEPCDLEVFRFGNNLSFPTEWDGNPDSLVGLDNPNIEGGAISNLDDYAKILMMHLNHGACGENQVLSAEAVEFMRIERTLSQEGEQGYGMGWWTQPAEEGSSIYLYTDAGFYGSVSWIDVERNYAGYVALEEYSGSFGGQGSGMVISELIPLIEEAIDAVR
ncbi:MAG: CubicO group peptidase (beta-lactamase class C family) [Halieaceae bacterium]|jgi:CubicO group peptidase (beta-lactamase class C family)